MTKILDLEEAALNDAVVLIRTRDGRRVSLTKDQILDLLAVNQSDAQLRSSGVTAKYNNPNPELDDASSISLFSLGKRVAGLAKTNGEKRKIGFYDAALVYEWLHKFNGEIPQRFSSKVGQRLREIQKWDGCTSDLKSHIDDFLTKFPRLDQDGKRK